jgi:hypothetical protein
MCDRMYDRMCDRMYDRMCDRMCDGSARTMCCREGLSSDERLPLHVGLCHIPP